MAALCSAADKVQIDSAILRGRSWLLKQRKTGPEGSLACYALVKAGLEKNHPDVLNCAQEILTKCKSTAYVPIMHHHYEASVDAMLLEAIDAEGHRKELGMIADYIITRQNPNGAWYYDRENQPTYGDTSITQYALLGLWAAARAGVDVPTPTWENAARWLIQTQCSDGGFAYQPFPRPGRTPDQLLSSITMTAAGSGSLLIVRRILSGNVPFDEEMRPNTSSRRFGVLERFAEDTPLEKPKVRIPPTLSVSTIDKALKSSMRWTEDHFDNRDKLFERFTSYYLYGIERVAALLDVEKIGPHDWYDEGAGIMLLRQRPDGKWEDELGAIPATSLSLLFLTKATSTAITKPKRMPLVGGGLLVGGRGLPDNLDAVQVTDGQVGSRKMLGPVDGLLAELEKSGDAKVEAVQAAIVETVQLDRPEELIAQVDRLKKLATDARVEVRRTAMWALGRTGDISVAPRLIGGLNDADEAVSREASLALSILSRRPDGCGLPLDPTDGLKEDASDDERKAHLEQWRTESVDRWQKWYLRVRPYDERDDRTLLRRKP